LLEPRSELPPNAPRGAQTFGSTSSSEVFEHVALRPELNRRLSTMNLTAGTPPPTSPLNLKLPDLSNAVQYFSKQPPSKDAYQALGSILLQQAEAALDIPKVVELRQHIGTQISNLDELEIFISTWNVGNAAPEASEIGSWLPARNTYDVVAVGFQECEYKLSTEMAEKARQFSLLQKHVYPSNHGSESNKADISSPGVLHVESGGLKYLEKELKSVVTSNTGAHLASMVLDHLGPESFYLVEKSELMQMRLFIFARIEHKARIGHVEAASQGTGVGGVRSTLSFLSLSLS